MFFQAWKQGLVSEQFITALCQELDGLSQDESFGSYRQAASNMGKYLTSRVGADRLAPGRRTSRGLSNRGSRLRRSCHCELGAASGRNQKCLPKEQDVAPLQCSAAI